MTGLSGKRQYDLRRTCLLLLADVWEEGGCRQVDGITRVRARR